MPELEMREYTWQEKLILGGPECGLREKQQEQEEKEGKVLETRSWSEDRARAENT